MSVRKLFQLEAFPLIAGPTVLLLHNLEEAATMPAWVHMHHDFIQSLFPSFVRLHFAEGQIYSSLIIASILPWIAVLAALLFLNARRRLIISILINGIILANAFLPHSFLSFVMAGYNPGVVSALFINIPITSIALRKSFIILHAEQGRYRYLIASVALYLPVAIVIHFGGECIQWIIH
jgi:hypothetical protein